MAMDGIDAAAATRSGGTESGRAAGVFLHAGWRSCGTWIWEQLRESARVQAFYEPLHEDLAGLRVRDIGSLRPDSWQSGHGTGAPYFAEYAPLLRARGGVTGYAARFAFDHYFRQPEQEDAALESYLRLLVVHAMANGRLPVLKFCRSLGRVPWLEARFPDMLHVVILRDPLAQWRSARRQMELNGNRYFVVAPFVILARNAGNALLAEAADRLAVKCPPQLGRSFTRDLSVTTDVCWRHVSRLSWQDRFRGFLAFWTASNIAALRGSATLIDADCLSGASEPRGDIEAALARATGLRVDLGPDPINRGEVSEAERAEFDGPLQAALAFLQANGAHLPGGGAAIMAAKLRHGDVASASPLLRSAAAPGPFAYADAAAYVGLMRASYPLRRAHFHIRRWAERL